MSTRVLMAAWCLVGLVVWSAAYDWWMQGAAREYLLQMAMHELGRHPEPSMVALMAEARHSGFVRASTWAVLVTGAGWLTIYVLRK